MVNWEQIDNVFLDMDGTLLDLHFDNYFWLTHLPKRYAQIHGKSSAEAYKQLMAEFQKKRGSLHWYCLEYWQDYLDLDIVSLKREVADRIKFRPEAKKLLVELRAKGKHLALVSNAHRWSINLKMEKVLEEHLFDAIHSSHDFGYPKEEQAFWHSFQTAFAFNPERTVFIDDNEQVLESAEQYGIKHLFSIELPDSKGSPQDKGKYTQLQSFVEIVDG